MRVIAGTGIGLAAVILKRVRQRPQDRLRMTPADGDERAIGIGDEDRLVPDVAEIAGAVAPHHFIDIVETADARQLRRGAVGILGLPVVHRRAEVPDRLLRRRQPIVGKRGHAPVAFLGVTRLRVLEVVDRPEQGEPAIAIGRRQARDVGGVDDEDGVELETDRSRLNAAHAGEHEPRQDLLVAGAAADALGDLLEQAIARRVFDEPDQRFDVAFDGRNRALHLLCGQRRQLLQECEVAGGGNRANLGGSGQELAPSTHDVAPELKRGCGNGPIVIGSWTIASEIERTLDV
jgi:hypothetical protein